MKKGGTKARRFRLGCLDRWCSQKYWSSCRQKRYASHHPLIVIVAPQHGTSRIAAARPRADERSSVSINHVRLSVHLNVTLHFSDSDSSLAALAVLVGAVTHDGRNRERVATTKVNGARSIRVRHYLYHLAPEAIARMQERNVGRRFVRIKMYTSRKIDMVNLIRRPGLGQQPVIGRRVVRPVTTFPVGSIPRGAVGATCRGGAVARRQTVRGG